MRIMGKSKKGVLNKEFLVYIIYNYILYKKKYSITNSIIGISYVAHDTRYAIMQI